MTGVTGIAKITIIHGQPWSNQKAEVTFHYSFWNFYFQIEKQKLHLRNHFSRFLRNLNE